MFFFFGGGGVGGKRWLWFGCLGLPTSFTLKKQVLNRITWAKQNLCRACLEGFAVRMVPF